LQQGKIHPSIRAETIKIIRIAFGTHILLALSTSLVPAQASTNNGGGLSASPPPASCAASTVPNANQLALLRWYEANEAASFM